MKFLKENQIFVAIVILGTILRILALTWHDFWFDEALTYHFAKLPIDQLLRASATDFNPPLYYLLIHFLLKLNQNELWLRLPSLIASVAIIPILYFWSVKYNNKRATLISISLFAVSPLSIYLATEARPHSLAILFVPLLSISFFKLIAKPQATTILTFAVVATLAIYTQYYLILLFLPFALIVIFLQTRLSLANFLIITSVPLLSILPWLIFSARFEHNPCWCPNTLLSLPASLVSPSIAGVGVVTLRSYPNLPFLTLAFFATTTIIVLIFFFKGLVRNLKITAIYLMPLTILSTLGLFLPIFSPKAFAIFSPIFFIIVGLGIDSVKQKRQLALLAFFVLGIISIVQITNPFFAGEKLEEISQITAKDPTSPILHSSLLTYYSTKFYTQDKQQNLLITPNPLSSSTVKYIGGDQTEIDPQSPSLWLVDTLKWADPETHRDNVNNLLRDYETISDHQLDNISVSYLKKRK